MHLNAEQLIDIAEGTRSESAAPHLAACAPCRAQLSELRAMMSAANEADVPEPSPLFWDHLSSRVSAAVAAEPASRPSPSWVERLMAVRAYAFVTVAATVLIAAAISSRVQAPAPLLPPAAIGVTVSPPQTVPVADARPELLSDVTPDDPSLTLVASLTDDLDLETAREAGLAPRGSADHAVTHLSDGELNELGRLLKEELARTGA
jgi:hypothetical protein